MVFEKLTKTDLSPDERDAVTVLMVIIYQNMGYTDKAVALAENQASLIACKELLLPKASGDILRDRYQGEAIISMLIEMKSLIITSVQTRSILKSGQGTEILISFAKFFESIFSGDKRGIGHYHLCELYLYIALFYVRYGQDFGEALKYFDLGFEEKKKYSEAKNGGGNYMYTSPLLSKVSSPTENFPALNPDFRKIWEELFPREFWEKICENEKYVECF